MSDPKKGEVMPLSQFTQERIDEAEKDEIERNIIYYENQQATLSKKYMKTRRELDHLIDQLRHTDELLTALKDKRANLRKET